MADIYQGPGPVSPTPSERTAPRAEPKTRPRPAAKVGTAWLVAGGLFVTCHHVVSKTKLITLVLPGGTRVKASIVVADVSNDLALLRPEGSLNLPPALPLAAVPARSGEQVFTVGYPHPDILGGEAKATDGIVSATSGLQGDPRMYQISVPVQAGNSGGPLFNMRGEVVGIVVSKLNATRVFAWTGDLPENVNYAVKSSYVRLLLQLPDTQSGGAVGGTDSLPNLVGRLRSSVALLLAE